jgi:hypothetical protein
VSVVRLYDLATGSTIATLPAVAGGSYQVLTFTPDGRTFWTQRLHGPVATDPRGPARLFEQWPVPAAGVPWWLIAVTAFGAALIAADAWRLRRRWAARRSGESPSTVNC